MPCHSLRKFYQHLHPPRDIYTLNTPEFLARLMNSMLRSSWLQIRYLLHKPWFQRVWVIQEVLMARSAQLFNASKSIAWSKFVEVAERIIVYNMGSLFTASRISLLALKNILLMHSKNSEFRRSFFTLLFYTRGFKSTDPRDKLYAILGISDSDAVT
jgi:hypothetical protein